MKRPCPCCATPREMAEAIAFELFKAGDHKVADRIELKFKRNGFEQSGGGWCQAAVVDVIARALGEHPNCKKIAAKLAVEAKRKRKSKTQL